METYLPITYLNDFIFCPYSLYLHQVFDQNSEDAYSALPQQRGKAFHAHIDSFEEARASEKEKVLKGIYVISRSLGVYGKIDTLHLEEKKLVESKYFISRLYQGYYYQIWSQYFALCEMGFEVSSIEFFSIKDSITIPLPIPKESQREELKAHIRKVARFDFETEIKVNPSKCRNCIYAALCDKTQQDHVYA